VTYGYDGNGNRVLDRDALGNTVTRTFSAANQVLTQTRYRIPDPDGAGPQRAGDPLTTRYAYDGTSRLRFTVSPEGRVTENRYGTASSGYGLLTHTLQYTGQVYDVTGLGADAELTEAQLTAWVAGLPDKTRARLTEYRYDLRGNMSRQMIYATVDAAGAGVLDDQASVTEYRYDAHGRLRRRTVVRGSARDERFVVASFGYDGMGRVVTSTDASGTQATGYDDAGGRITVTATSGLTETRSYDNRGRLVRVRQTGEATTGAVTTRPTRYVYDNGDQLRMAEDAQGGRRYRFYDAIGRLEFAVDATGAVTRSEYNATGQVIRQTQYLNRADTGSWFDSATQTVTKLSLAVGGAGSDLPADPEHDRVTTFEYDAAGRLTRTTEAAGHVTTTRHDGASRVTMTQTGDRVTRHLYDKDDRKAGAVDPLGYLTEYRYDAGGSLIETARYGQRSQAAANTSAPVWVGGTNQTAVAGKPFEYHVPAYDPDGDQLTVSVVGTPPGWLSFDAGTATLRGTAPAAGTDHQVTLRADDGRGKTSVVTVLITVINPAPPSGPGGAGPTGAPLSPLEVTTNIPVSYVVPAATGPSLTYRVVSGLPAGLSFNPADQTISGRASGAGFSTIVLRAAKADGQSVDRTLSVRIRAAASAPDQPAGSDELSDWRPADPSALRSYLYYDGQGRVVGAVDERQFLTETVHDDARSTQRTSCYFTPVTVGAGDTLASLKSRAGAARQTSLVQYDGFGRVLVTTGLDGSTQTRNEYDQAGRLTRAVSAADTAEQRGRRTFYNAFGEVTATLGGEGDASLGTNPTPEQVSQAIRDYGTRSEYDTLGRAIRTVDANGNRTLLYYDRENRLTHTIYVLGHGANNTLAGEVSETTYTSFGQAASVRRYATRLADADMDQLLASGGGGFADQFLLSTLAALADPDLDSFTSSDYDRNGRLEKEADSEGGVTVNVYNPHGELAAQVRSLSEGRSTTTQVDYDQAGRVVSRTEDVGGINANTQTAYDAFGRITRSTDQLGNVTTTAHQDSGRVVVVTDSLHRATRTEYEALGRVLSTVDALSQRTKYSYDDSARSVTVTTPEKVQVTTTRTRHGELASSTDGRGNVTSYAYDKDGQQTTVTDPLGQVTTKTTYDRSGRKHEVIDARGTVIRFSYDQRNRVTGRRLDPAGLNLTTRFEFDALGRQVQVTDGANTAAARTTAYLYDRKGRVRKEVVFPGGLRLCTSYGYDHRDNIVTLARGTVSSPDQHVTQHEFDSLGRRTKEVSAPSPVFGVGSSGTRDLTTQYRYDAAGRVIRRIEANGQSTWQVYDAAAQLTYAISAHADREIGIAKSDFALNMAGLCMLVRVPDRLACDAISLVTNDGSQSAGPALHDYAVLRL
jgi:YD repeat-containing protein